MDLTPIYGKAKRQHISPYLERLHFLPVRYRIMYKIALLVFKCLNNIAPKYLSSLIRLRDTKRQSVRLDNDFYLLKVPPCPHFTKTEAAFSYSGPNIWNQLPYDLRCLNDIRTFKKQLKTHYFEYAFGIVE